MNRTIIVCSSSVSYLGLCLVNSLARFAFGHDREVSLSVVAAAHLIHRRGGSRCLRAAFFELGLCAQKRGRHCRTTSLRACGRSFVIVQRSAYRFYSATDGAYTAGGKSLVDGCREKCKMWQPDISIEGNGKASRRVEIVLA